MGWTVRIVAGATAVVAAAALVGFGLALPAAVQAADERTQAAAPQSDPVAVLPAGDAVATHAAVVASERIAAVGPLVAPGHELVAATDGLIDAAPRLALEQALAAFEGSVTSAPTAPGAERFATRSSIVRLDPDAATRVRLGAAAAKAEAVHGALEVVRAEIAATAQRVLDSDTPDAGAARDALAAALADRAVLVTGSATPAALLAVVSATRAAQAAQSAFAEAQASSGSSEGSDEEGSEAGNGGGPHTPSEEELAWAAENSRKAEQDMIDSINAWMAQQPPVLSCEETPACRGW
jgi:hypothetical protein